MNNKLMKTVALALLVMMLPALSVFATDTTPTTTPSETVTPAPDDNITDETTSDDNLSDDTAQQVKAPEDYRDGILSFYAENSTLTSWWDVVALYGAGADLTQYTLPQWTSESLGENASATDYAGIIFGLIASGGNPHDFFGRDIAEELAKIQKTDTGLFGSYPNQQIYAMLALNAAKEPYDKESALTALIDTFISPEGAFGYLPFDPSFGTEVTADVDITALALLLLDKSAHSEIIGSCIAYLASQQLDNGGYASWGTENSNTLESVISALASLGLLEDERFIKNDRSLSDVLGDYILENGMLTWESGSTDENLLATQQGLIAYGDIIAGKSVFLRLSSDEVCTTLNATVRIEGSAANVLSSAVSVKGYKPSVLDAITAALDKNSIPYVVEGSEYGSYISSINSETEGKFGGWDGWLVVLNGTSMSASADSTELSENDSILVYYGMFEPQTLIPQYTISTEAFTQNTPFEITVTATYFDYTTSQTVTVPISGATVDVNGVKFTTDQSGTASVIPNLSGTNIIKIYKDNINSYPSIVRTEPFEITAAAYVAPPVIRPPHRPSGGGGSYVRPTTPSAGKTEKPAETEKDETVKNPEETENKDDEKPVVQPEFKLTYTDTDKISAWAVEGVKKAVESGLFKGDDKNNFNPANNISRAEFATVLLRLTKTPEKASDASLFTDVSRDAWYYGAVSTVCNAGLMNGMGDKLFAPAAFVTREQAAVVLARVLKLTPSNSCKYNDSDNFSVWATDSISAISEAGIMEGFDGNFRPQDTLTREMCAVILTRALEFIAEK